MINISDNKPESVQPVDLLEDEPELSNTRVLVDEYGDPLIAGPYAVQQQPDVDVLYPGRKTKSDSDELEAEIEKTPDEIEKQPVQWKSFLVPVFISICVIGIFLTFVVQALKIGQNAEVKKLATSRVLQNLPAKPAPTIAFDVAIAKALASYNGSDLNFQQALATAKTRDEGMKLIAIADELLRKGNARAAELVYRRALSVLGLSAGEKSWEYQLVLSRLSFIFQSNNRLQEQQEINEYSKRLTSN